MFSSTLVALLAVSTAHALNFTTPLEQCANTTLTWAQGQPPYEILLVPIGHVKPETRVIINYQNLTSPSFTFPLTLPANSQFVATVSDVSGPGALGTSPVLTVSSSSQSSCLPPTPSRPEFYFYLHPQTPSQCKPLDVTWDASETSPPSIWAIIPGKSTFAVPIPNNATSSDGVSWTVDVKEGQRLLLVAGNQAFNGRGKGGSTDLLAVGSSAQTGCLATTNASSTLSGFPYSATSFSLPTPLPSGVTAVSATAPAPTQSSLSSAWRTTPSSVAWVITTLLFSSCFF